MVSSHRHESLQLNTIWCYHLKVSFFKIVLSPFFYHRLAFSKEQHQLCPNGNILRFFFANKLAFSRAALIFRIGPIHSLYIEFSMVYFLEKIIRFCKTYSFISPNFWHSLAGKTNKICTVEMSSDISKSCTFFVNFYSKKKFIDWINNEWTRWNLKTVFLGFNYCQKQTLSKFYIKAISKGSCMNQRILLFSDANK